MNAHQALAFRYPLMAASHLHLNAVVDTVTGELRGPPSDPVDKHGVPIPAGKRTAEQKRQAQLGPHETYLMRHLSYLERGPWGVARVTLIVDATGTGREEWAVWHATVTMEVEVKRDTPGGALPMQKWRWQHARAAERILRKALADVGDDAHPLWIADIGETRRACEAAGQLAVGLSARRLLTVEEAETCLRDRPDVLARLNPAWRAMHTN